MVSAAGVSKVSESEQRNGGVRDYAKHRRARGLVGGTHNAVRKAIAAKRLSASVSYVVRHGKRVPQIDFEVADLEWERNTDPVESTKNTPAKSGCAEADAAAPGARSTATDRPRGPAHALVDELALGIDQQPSGQPWAASSQEGADQRAASGSEQGYLEHRAKREKFLADQAELDYLRNVGQLVSAAEVDREVSEIFNQVKSSVMRLVPKKAPQWSAETDPGRLERLMNEAFTQVFDELSHGLAADAAGWLEERAAAVP